MNNRITDKINNKTKPIGSLGQLEEIAAKICIIQKSLEPILSNPTILVFAADHGIADSGVSAYPSEVTAQMVINFLNGGAAINVFCKQHDINLKIIDAGVNYDFENSSNEIKLIDAKVAYGTQSFLDQNAMSAEELLECFNKSKTIIASLDQTNCNIIGFGEMGIANTSSAAMLMSELCGFSIEQCVGRGTGLNDDQLHKKITILKQSQHNHAQRISPALSDDAKQKAEKALMQFGGFEIAQICAAMLASFEKNMIIMVDGFIASAAFLCAYTINPNIMANAIFCHQSDEQGHKQLLDYLGVTPILNLNMRLGEGTGCAIAYPIIESAVRFINEMASFDSAGVAKNNS